MVSLRERREAIGLSQADLAERASVSRATIGAVEQGRQVPAADAAVRIARALGTTVEALFARGEPSLLTVEPVLGGALTAGEAVRAGSVAGSVVVAPLGQDEWAAPDGVIDSG